MKTVVSGFALVASLLLFGGAAQAEAAKGGVGLRLGTAGIGLDYSYPVNPYLDVRGAANFGSYSRDQAEDGIDYEFEFGFSAVSAFADIRPFQGGFRITAGAYSSAPGVDFKGGSAGTQTYEIGDGTYNAQIDIDGDIDIGGFSPYLGIGWGGTTGKRGFGMSFDAGVIFASAPDISFNVNGVACDASTNGTCDPNGAEGFDVNDGGDPRAQEFQTQKDNEVENLEADLSDLDLYPVISLGFHYRF